MNELDAIFHDSQNNNNGSSACASILRTQVLSYVHTVQDVYHERETRFLLFGKTSCLARAIVSHFDVEKFDTS